MVVIAKQISLNKKIVKKIVETYFVSLIIQRKVYQQGKQTIFVCLSQLET